MPKHHKYIYLSIDDLINAAYKHVGISGDLIIHSSYKYSFLHLYIELSLSSKYKTFYVNWKISNSLLFDKINAAELNVIDYINEQREHLLFYA